MSLALCIPEVLGLPRPTARGQGSSRLHEGSTLGRQLFVTEVREGGSEKVKETSFLLFISLFLGPRIVLQTE